jgi:hypothetical protein
MTKMGGIFRQQGDIELGRNGLGFEPPKRAAAPPGEAADGGTAENATGDARSEPPGLTYKPPRRGRTAA